MATDAIMQPARSGKKRWSDLTETQQRLAIVAGAVEAVLTSFALNDLRTRPSSQVRGPKALWLLAIPIQPIGPIAYLVFGRRT
jgi:hypothetical protein